MRTESMLACQVCKEYRIRTLEDVQRGLKQISTTVNWVGLDLLLGTGVQQEQGTRSSKDEYSTGHQQSSQVYRSIKINDHLDQKIKKL